MKLSYFSEAVYIVNIVFHSNCSKVIHDLCIRGVSREIVFLLIIMLSLYPGRLPHLNAVA